jgi:arginase
VAAVRDGRLPVVAGGNCNVALGMVAGLRRAAGEPLGIAWFDAHGDFNTPQTSPGGFLDGMPLAMAVGRAHRDAVWSNLGDEPVAEAHALHVGARDLDPGEELNFQAAAVLRVTGSQLSAGGVAAAAEAFRQLAERVPAVYLHIDIDVLDPRFVPAIDFPTPGGLSPDELLDLVAALRAHLPFAGISLTAYDPVVPDPDQLTLSTSMAVLARLCRLAEE